MQLLADFTVSLNATRVVVITYSSVDRVIRQIDHVSRPNPHLHKCHLLQASSDKMPSPFPTRPSSVKIDIIVSSQEEIPAITYNSGGTYTLGALMQAVEVLQVKDYRQLGGHRVSDR